MLNPLFPVPELQVKWEARKQWESPRPDTPSKLWLDHMESVAQFQSWKREHPHDGTMTTLYRWAPVVLVSVAVLTLNPMVLVAGLCLGGALRKKPA